MMLVKGSYLVQCKVLLGTVQIRGQFKEEKAILNQKEHLEPKRNWAMLL